MVRRRREWSLPGHMGATALGALAFTPSLLPRGWALQGLVAGLSAASGYALGVGVAWLVRGFTGWRPSARTVGHWRRVLRWCAPVVALLALWQGHRWQTGIHELMGLRPPSGPDWLRLTIVAFVVYVVAVSAGRLVAAAVRLVERRLARRLPRRIAAPTAVLLVLAMLVVLNDNVVWRGVVDLANTSAGNLNNTTVAGIVQPQWPQVSGSPTSYVPWDSLGKQGRTFVASAPTTSELRRFSGVPARRPIRVYVGIKSADGLAAQAALAVRELQRTGAFRRAAVLVTTSTGTGWVDPAAVEPLEYMYNGNTAVVTLQYSYLWSALSFIVDGARAREAGAALFDAVYDIWRAMPSAHRPKLLVTGTSLGAAGAEGAFSGLADMQNRTNGVVLAGAPYIAQLHRALTAARDPGSPQRTPVYRAGRVVRFGSVVSDWRRLTTSWTAPRVLYLQNGSDPIVAWSPGLAFRRPDWLAEPAAADVLPEMRWIPIVTFLQVSADLPFSMHAGAAHGHNYKALFPWAWADVAAPTGWSDADTARLTALLT